MRVDFFYKKRGTDPEIPEDFFDLTAAEDLAKYVYYAKNSLNSDGEPASDLESILTIPALKGGINIPYVGDSGPDFPTLTKRPPVYRDYLYGSISFDNEPYTWYAVGIPDILFPYEASFVMVMQYGASHEAFTNNYNAYIGDSGGPMRIMGPGNTIPNSNGPNKLHYAHVHVLFEATQGTLWVDGVNEGTIQYEPQSPDGMGGNQIGTPTNNVQWEFIAHHVFDRQLTPEERNQFFLDIKAKFNIGSPVQLPQAKDITVNKTGSNLTVSYTYFNPLGFPEDKTKTIYRWVYLDEGFLYDQNVIDGQGSSISTDLIVGITEGNVKCEVQVFDTMGNTWKRLTGEFSYITNL